MSLAERSRAAEVIKKFFSKQPQYVFGFIVGSGASGLAMCFHDTLAKPDESQRFVVKTAHSDEGGDIVNEKIWLEVLRWAAHIINPITLYSNPLGSSFKKDGQLLTSKPYLILEYLENGSIKDFLEKHRTAVAKLPTYKRRLPNRVLWSLFLCLTRACVAMAYPPPSIEKPPNPRVRRLEKLCYKRPDNIIHNDMHSGNLMFGELGSQYLLGEPICPTEHFFVPILKLIDFGEAKRQEKMIETPRFKKQKEDFDEKLLLKDETKQDTEILAEAGHEKGKSNDKLSLNRIRKRDSESPSEPEYKKVKLDDELLSKGKEKQDTESPSERGHKKGSEFPAPAQGPSQSHNYGTIKNIRDIGTFMGRLILKDFSNYSTEGVRDVMVENLWEGDFGADPNLDRDLFYLVARCIAVDPVNVPSLSHLVALTSGYNSMKTEASYPDIPEEKDDFIYQLIKEQIFDRPLVDKNVEGSESQPIWISSSS